MNHIVAYRKPDVWKNTLSCIIAFTFIIAWLPFIRSVFDGDTYQWGLVYFGMPISGNGLSGDFYFLLLQLALYGTLFLSMYWTNKRRIFYVALMIWYIHIFGSLLAEIVINGDIMFHGDTLDVHVRISWLVITLSLLALFLAIKVIHKDMNQQEIQINWHRANKILIYVMIGILPVQLVLLSTGTPHDTTDEIGVILALIQCFMIPFVIKPYVTRNQEAVA